MPSFSPLPGSSREVATTGGQGRRRSSRPSICDRVARSNVVRASNGRTSFSGSPHPHAYVLGKDRRLLSVNLETGNKAWRTDERFGEYWSLVANRGKVLALDNRGILYLLR